MANEQNLIPLNKRTKSEQRKVTSEGGKASGEARRKKRDAKASIRMLLEMDVPDVLNDDLESFGYVEGDRTNMDALTAALFVKAMKGDISAYKALMDYGGYHPDQELKDKKQEAEIKAMERENTNSGVPDDTEDLEDVVIYIPDNGRDQIEEN